LAIVGISSQPCTSLEPCASLAPALRQPCAGFARALHSTLWSAIFYVGLCFSVQNTSFDIKSAPKRHPPHSYLCTDIPTSIIVNLFSIAVPRKLLRTHTILGPHVLFCRRPPGVEGALLRLLRALNGLQKSLKHFPNSVVASLSPIGAYRRASSLNQVPASGICTLISISPRLDIYILSAPEFIA
jgi:hypothetical protein